jgi:hypothetical protein
MGIPGVAKYFSDASLRAAPVQMIMGNPRYSQFLALGPGKQITREFAPGTSYGTPGMKMPWDYFSHFTLPRAQQQQRVIGSRWREMMRERAQRPIPERYGSGLDMFQQFLKGDEGIKLKQLISQLLSLFGKG